MSYFDYPNCSNSQLSQLAREIRGEDTSSLPLESFRKGNLFDFVVTEPEKIELASMTMQTSNGIESFTMEEYNACLRMRKALMVDPAASLIINNSAKQVEIYDHPVAVNTAGLEFSITFKAKLDFYWKGAGTVSDLKSTSAANLSAFTASAERHQYWRQLYLYMQLTGAKHATILAANWKAQTFILQMKEGDDNWKKGKAWFEELALLWYIIKMEGRQ